MQGKIRSSPAHLQVERRRTRVTPNRRRRRRGSSRAVRPENRDRTRVLDGDDAERAAAALAGGTAAGVVSTGGVLGAAGSEPETREIPTQTLDGQFGNFTLT